MAVYDAGEIDGVLFLAMQFVEGDDLARLLKRDGPARSPARAACVITQIAAALDAAHERGLVHRDVKPANVLVEGDRCYLADFGLTKLTGATAATMTGDVLGTLSYAAPEQIEGGAIDRRADVYALGCTAYECLVGQTPFAHRAGAALLYAQLTEAAAAPDRPPPRRCPTAVDAVLARALAKRPTDRFATCGELAAALAGRDRGAAPAAPPPAAPAARRGVPLPPPLARCRTHPLVGRERELGELDGRARRRRRRAAGRRLPRRRAGDRQDAARGRARRARPRRRRHRALRPRRRGPGDPLRAVRGGAARAVRAPRRRAAAAARPPRSRRSCPSSRVLGAPPPTGDAGADRYRMFEASLACSRTPGARRPVVLVLEDLQWADKASCCCCATCSRARRRRGSPRSSPTGRCGSATTIRSPTC